MTEAEMFGLILWHADCCREYGLKSIWVTMRPELGQVDVEVDAPMYAASKLHSRLSTDLPFSWYVRVFNGEPGNLRPREA